MCCRTTFVVKGATTNQAAFIKGLRGDQGALAYRTFERWAEMAYRALARPLAGAAEADALGARYQPLAEAVGPGRVQGLSSELLALVVDDVTESGGGDFLVGPPERRLGRWIFRTAPKKRE